ncbi:TcaA NTF2-like domain-containing protein [Mesobacillus jeotgali]|uniref:TcaA NTF2-like domain-containing protein n=1 Tax=Mesobacillus jeotgali TaxID=129985 RepID=UPI00177B9A7F|nr:dynamin family protein [Mesobacillus jeotgali]UYZ21767.1 dynamin family protein [Mesobacillus jeotgali]
MEWNEHLKKGLDRWIGLSEGGSRYESIMEQLKELRKDINDEMTVMVAGEFNAGKSTFINALLGQKVLSSDVTPETAMVTKLTYGQKRKVIAHFLNGEEKVYDDAWLEQLTAERDGKLKKIRHKLSHVELQLPIKFLQSFTIIDTPGLNANNKNHTQATERFLKRTDIAIWLFHYLNVGTSTDVEWIKKFIELGINPIGIVNRIDEMDYSDDDELEDFLDFQVRRLSPVINKLIAVSAKEALKGKLEKNSELMEWSNWGEVDHLFSSFAEQKEKKLERTFQRVKPLLEQLDKLLLIEKLGLPLSLMSQEVPDFMSKDFPALHSIKEKLDSSTKETERVVDQWNTFLDRKMYSVENVDDFLQGFLQFYKERVERKNNVKKNPQPIWEIELQPQYQLFNDARQKFHDDLIELNHDRDLLVNQWNHLKVDGPLFKKKKLEKHERIMEKFNLDRAKMAGRRKQLTDQYNSIVAKLKWYEQKISKLATEDISPCVNKQNRLLKDWNTQLESANKSYAKLYKEDIGKVRQLLKWLKAFVEGVANPLHIAGQMSENNLPYEEAAFILNHFETMSEELPTEEFFLQWDQYKTYTKDQERNFKLSLPILLPPEMSSSELLQVPAELKHEVQEEIHQIIASRNKWLKRSAVAAIIALPLIGMISLDYDKGSPVYGENDSYDEEMDAEDNYADSYEEGYEDTEVIDSEEDKRLLEEKFGQIEISSFLNSMIEQMVVTSNYQSQWFSDSGWYDFSPYSEEIQGGEVVSLEVAGIDYLSGNQMKAAVIEKYLIGGFEKQYETEYLIQTYPNGYDDELITSGFSYTLSAETEVDIPVAEGELEQFVADFRYAYMEALNTGDSSYILSYLEPGSMAYDELTEYVAKVAGKGYSFEEKSVEVNGIEQLGTNQYKATTQEIFIFTDEKGNKWSYDRTKDYILKLHQEAGPAIQEIIIGKTNKTKVTVPTAHLVDTYAVDQFIRNYYSDFREAFNGAGFSYVEAYYNVGDAGYESAKAYIERANSKNMMMTNIEFTVDSINQQDENHYLVSAYIEDQYAYQDGTGDIKKLRAQYKVRVTLESDMYVSGEPEITIIEEIEN